MLVKNVTERPVEQMESKQIDVASLQSVKRKFDFQIEQNTFLTLLFETCLIHVLNIKCLNLQLSGKDSNEEKCDSLCKCPLL